MDQKWLRGSLDTRLIAAVSMNLRCVTQKKENQILIVVAHGNRSVRLLGDVLYELIARPVRQYATIIPPPDIERGTWPAHY